ncbi:hypothetical protein Ppa06_36920 [Planomonospora parontospora subsp. parontospora]|uniref:Uncharacterized protein n=2 Tax=Planomonospora parontospora TaxID=58119 RepID=A0AA37BGS1_9ACTN|nr:hypothetical protein [Planomonospora parontospora]GGK69825.1 hypothetical protein GCM10010126_31520 [Planomonospora parontospora]GII09894.1 hypothetical protein Ppa06_36920 [Planomonospora parontospora subsp. parontospora]
MHSWADHWPIVDPTIPPRDKRRIIGNRELMGISTASPGGHIASRVSRANGCLVTIAAVFCLAIIRAIGEAAIKVPWVGLALLILIAVAAAALLTWKHLESPKRLARLYRDRYVIPSDLDNEAHSLFNRATNATMTVSWSQVSRQGFLDSVANDVLFPQQLWEISRLLRFQSILRAEQAAATRGVVLTPELLAVLAPQQQALQHSVAMVTQRIMELEAYARRVQEADAALRAHEQLQNNDKYRYLLAHTDDRMGMQNLMQQAAAVESTLTQSVQSAIAAGQTLAMPDLRQWR